MEFNIIMAKSLTIIFVSFIFSTSISFGKDACDNYEDKDCVHPNILKNGHFINQWTVNLPGMTKDEARKLLEDNGFDYLGKIMDGVDLHLVTKKGTHEKHALPNERIIELLKKHEKVHSVAQKHVLENSQDEVINIINEDNIKFEFLDPNTIVLNDGKDNLERITAFEAAEATNAEATNTEATNAEATNTEAANAAASPDYTENTKTNVRTVVDGGDHGNPKKKHDDVSSSNYGTPSGSSDYDDSPELDLSNETFSAADPSNNESSDKETSDEEVLDETETRHDE